MKWRFQKEWSVLKGSLTQKHEGKVSERVVCIEGFINTETWREGFRKWSVMKGWHRNMKRRFQKQWSVLKGSFTWKHEGKVSERAVSKEGWSITKVAIIRGSAVSLFGKNTSISSTSWTNWLVAHTHTKPKLLSANTCADLENGNTLQICSFFHFHIWFVALCGYL